MTIKQEFEGIIDKNISRIVDLTKTIVLNRGTTKEHISTQTNTIKNEALDSLLALHQRALVEELDSFGSNLSEDYSCKMCRDNAHRFRQRIAQLNNQLKAKGEDR